MIWIINYFKNYFLYRYNFKYLKILPIGIFSIILLTMDLANTIFSNKVFPESALAPWTDTEAHPPTAYKPLTIESLPF